MRNAMNALVIVAAIAGFGAAFAPDTAVPEIARPDATAQVIGALHTLRTIPEACARLEGEFSGDPTEPYHFEAVATGRCAQRAEYVAADALKSPPGVESGWILNDRIRVPRADAPACIATIEVWRKPGNAAPPALDTQGRSRIYLDKQPKATLPMFTAVLRMDVANCR